MKKSEQLGLGVMILLGVGLGVVAWQWLPAARRPTASIGASERGFDGMVRIPGGTFRMGNDFSDRSEIRPAHDVTLDSFWIDRDEVTNRQFAAFVQATGYITTAQRRGWSHVFDRQKKRWVECAGADWLHPGGPDTSLDNRDDHPVVHISWFDASAYARWAGKRLPTEAQWECAARGGLRDADYPWGTNRQPDGRPRSNTWQGWFPDEDTGEDGHRGPAPVGAFGPSGYGLNDTVGNVWEWCADWYAADYYDRSPIEEPPGPDKSDSRVCRGGAWTTPPTGSHDATVWARAGREPDFTREDLGFRCVHSE
ncbi:MAG: formylglycine-generating enzyme family protein [Pirellulales bacterium]|nr:formylglycine-generating enzyme family protein [Pirellulales bacterium]